MTNIRRRLRLRVSYDGSEFHGWQVQPGLATIQAALELAIREVTGETVVVHGSGRTDAGVHALEQVAHIDLEARLPEANLQLALNTRLPGAIRVMGVEAAAPDFHARRDAAGKLYRYRLYRGPVCPPFLRRYVYHYPYRLDRQAMIEAAPAFVGRHDFRSFAATPTKGAPPLESTVRTVHRSELLVAGEEWIYEVEGEGFLHHMVRNLVGFLLEIGRGARRGSEIPAVLEARTRAAAGRTAPAQGLYLVSVRYEDDGKR